MREHLIQGFTINRIQIQKQGLEAFNKVIALIKQINTISPDLSKEQGFALLDLVTNYSNSWNSLQECSENKLTTSEAIHESISYLSYEEGYSQLINLERNFYLM